MIDRENPKNEGHTREWQDRSRVVLDAKEAVHNEASPNQSPVSNEPTDNVEEKSKTIENKQRKDDRFY